MGREIGTQLGLQGMLVKNATTDCYARSADRIDHALKVLHPMWNVHRLADPTHIGQSEFRQCNRDTFSHEMFPGRTREQRRKHRKSSVRI